MNPLTQPALSKAWPIQLPSDGHIDQALLGGVVGEACQRLKLPAERVQLLTTRGWHWEPITCASALGALTQFNELSNLVTEARSIMSHCISKEGQKSDLLAMDAWLIAARNNLQGNFQKELSAATNPLEVLREFFRIAHRGVQPWMVSAVLGIQEESVGGNSLRHPSSERETFWECGGHLYQPSEPRDLWTVFSLLSFKRGISFFDLGSGYGHALFQGAITWPDVMFRGIELMSVRVKECEAARKRLGLSNLSFVAGDIIARHFSEADVIFLFNPFPPAIGEVVAERINNIARRKPLAVIDYKGLVTQGVDCVTPIVVRDLAPYRVVCSKRFLSESCGLLGMPVPAGRPNLSR